LADAFPAKITALIRVDYGWRVYKPQFIEIYRKIFTQEDVDGLLSFYASPAGEAFTNKMPLVMQQTIQLMQSMTQTLAPKISALVEQQRAEMEAAKAHP
jgi:hypothetical protein